MRVRAFHLVACGVLVAAVSFMAVYNELSRTAAAQTETAQAYALLCAGSQGWNLNNDFYHEAAHPEPLKAMTFTQAVSVITGRDWKLLGGPTTTPASEFCQAFTR